jgi:hypothetical protein
LLEHAVIGLILDDLALLPERPVIEPNPTDLKFWKLYRGFAKGCLDFLRNIAVVGGLKYLSDKTGIIEVEVAYWIGVGALYVWAMRFFGPYHFSLFQSLKRRWLGVLLDSLITTVVVVGLMALALGGIDKAIEGIVAAQVR